MIKPGKTKSAKAPIYCRITINGKRAEISLKRFIEPAKWSASIGRVKGNSEEARLINLNIELLNNDVLRHYNMLIMEGKYIDSLVLKNSVLGVYEKQYTLIESFEYHNERMKTLIGIDVELGTYKKFETVLVKIKNFLKQNYQKKDINLIDLDFKFINDFEYYMKVQEKVKHNTALRYIRCLKKIVLMAIKNDWIQKNPFANYSCQYDRVNREVLSENDLKLLWKKEIGIPRLDEVKDVLLFCCYTGYSFSDVERISTNDLEKGIDGEFWIFTERKKTGITSNVPLLPEAYSIIQKYATHPYCNASGKLLPVKSNQKMNAYLKEVATICGIKKNLTMHMARHTFATTITLSNGVPIETVSKMLGHSKIATTQIYAQVLDNKVSADMKKLRSTLISQNLENTGS